MESYDSSREKETKPAKSEAPEDQPLNRRTHNRYIINAISVGDLGSIVEISKGGMRIRKMNSEDITGPKLIIPFLKKELKADIVWQDKKDIGLRYACEFDLVNLIKKLTLKIKEPAIRPKRVISDDAIAGTTRKDVLNSCINLMEELENLDADITKLRTYVEDISDVCHEASALEEKKTEEIEEIKELQPVEPEDLKELLIREASSASSAAGIEIKDIDFAIARLGLESVKKISGIFYAINYLNWIYLPCPILTIMNHL